LLQVKSLCHSDLRVILSSVSENPGGWDNDTLMMTSGCDRWLTKTSTCFAIKAHEDIFSETDALFTVLQNGGHRILLVCEFVTQMGLCNDRDKNLAVSMSDLSRKAPCLA